jgi:hypothetical protein
MLHISRDPATRSARYSLLIPQRVPPCTSSCHTPAPRVRDPVVMTFGEWMDKYEYFVTAMWNAFEYRVSNAIPSSADWNWDALRYRFELHAYRTSSSRYRSFVLLK